MAGLPPSSERGISQRPEIKLFEKVTLEEINQCSGGNLFFSGSGYLLGISYDKLQATISSNGLEEEYKSLFIFTYHSDVEFALDATAVILQEGAVTFVEPIYDVKDRDSENSKNRMLSWVTISRDEGLLLARKPISAVQDENILEAARIATQASEKRVEEFRANR